MKRSLLILITISFSIPVFAQQGYLKGRIYDDENGEELIGAAVSVDGTVTGAVTDFNGDFSLPLNPGTYNITVSSVSYATTTYPNIEIKDNNVTNLNVRMKTDMQELETVIVAADIVKDSEIGLLTVKRKSANVVDGMSSQGFRKVGDGNLSTAIRRVTGVSVEGGKYVYVRGLGDRYTKMTLNGMNLPGLDPDRNSMQIDIFPTSILENIMVYKTFTPDLFGDFSGGIVNIAMKDFPEEKTTNISLGLTLTSGVTFNKEYLSYQGGKTDWLGFDDGGRSLPFDKNTSIPNEVQTKNKLEDLTRKFNPIMSAHTKTALPGGNLSFTHGNQINKSRFTIGYNVVLNYQNSTSYFAKTESNRYFKDNDRSSSELFQDESRKGFQGQNNVLWSVLANTAIKFDNHILSFNILKIQNGETNASQRINQNFNQTGATLNENILTYTQRSVTNNIIQGKHNFDLFNVEWANSLNWSRVYDPDFRQTSVSVTGGDTTLLVGDGAGINRFYRDLKEFNESFKVDFSVPVGDIVTIKFGGIGTYKKRDYEVLNYLFRQKRVGVISTDADSFFDQSMIWTPETRTGTYVIGNFEAANTYSAYQTIFGTYLMSEIYLTPQVRSIFGARMEKGKMYYSGQNNSGSKVYDNEETLDEMNILPSLNIVYSIRDNINLRGSISRTLARPSFKEKSIAQIYDPISRRSFSGNIDLKQTDINNFDLRFEHFFKSGELFSISGFYKAFSNHIELVSFDTDPDNLKPRNSGNSEIYGAEIEFRKVLPFLHQSNHQFSLGSNITVVKSIVDMKSVIIDNSGNNEYDLRVNNLREEEKISQNRSMSGQAPYLINGIFNYDNEALNMNLNLSYTVQGETLFIIGSGCTPDVFTEPFHSLNFNIIQKLGNDLRHTITLGVNNMLGERMTNVYKSYNSDDVVYSRYRPGSDIKIKYNFSF